MRHKKVRVRFEFKLEDCWVGAYWHYNRGTTDIWICLLPMVPLHITVWTWWTARR